MLSKSSNGSGYYLEMDILDSRSESSQNAEPLPRLRTADMSDQQEIDRETLDEDEREREEDGVVACTRPLETSNAPWRRGVLSDVLIKVGGVSKQVHSQYFTNGSRASRHIFQCMD